VLSVSSGVNYIFFNLKIGLILKSVVPLSWFGTIEIKQNPLSDEEERSAVTSILRKSYRQSVRKTIKETEQFNRRQSMRAMSRRQSRATSIRSRQDPSMSVRQGSFKGGRPVSINKDR